jgi:hypothetical protein
MVKDICGFDIVVDFRYKHPVYKINRKEIGIVTTDCIGKTYFYIRGEGQHCADFDDLWDLRVVNHNLTQAEFEELKEEYSELKKSGKAERWTP